MTDTLKVLGQQFPAAATLTTLYTVPAATSATVSSITVCNQSSSAGDAFSVSIQVAGAADTPKQYVFKSSPIMPGDTYTGTLGITLGATDVVKCLSVMGTCSFNIFGVEVT